jgi:hypothetical protein
VGNAFVTALSVTHVTINPKALKVRFLEGKTGAEVLDFNLFLAAYDVWTAGIVGTGAGAGIFTLDNSCTLPKVSNSSAAPTRFRNAVYIGDQYGDSLDRTYEGYLEMLEMGAIDPASPLAASVTPRQDLTAPNASKPSCSGLPTTDTAPPGLSKPSGGLVGNTSYINVNEGTDYSVDAIALSQWSAAIQWSAAGNGHPNLADANPPVSYVSASTESDDLAYFTRWNSGRDAVTALFMVNRLRNDFTMEPAIKAATDWVLTMPTKRFYVSASQSEAPFSGKASAGAISYACERLNTNRCESEAPAYLTYDREAQEQHPRLSPDFPECVPPEIIVCGAAAAHAISGDANIEIVSRVFQSLAAGGGTNWTSAWNDGWFDLPIASWRYDSTIGAIESTRLIAPALATSIVNTATGQVTAGVSATYFGLPVVGFAGQSYSTTGLPGVAPDVLSNYGGVFVHKYFRRIEVQ